MVIPPALDGGKLGADDFIHANSFEKFQDLKRVEPKHPALSQYKSWWENRIKNKSKDAKAIDKLGARLVDVDPWKLPVDGAALLDEIRKTFERFVVTVQPQAVVVETLWTVFAHALDAFGIAPFLLFWSPLENSGKSTNLSIVSRLVPKPLEGSNMTEAIVFRVVEKFKPTVLIDEAADIQKNPELLALFRASHQRSKAFTYRCDPDTHEPRDFSTWAPKAFCVTVLDRAHGAKDQREKSRTLL